MLKKHWPIITLILISLILCVTNYTPGTILSGWDALHPEFNFPLNIQRVIFGVFRLEQGLGAVAGHAHMSDLPRIFLLFVFSFIFPTELLRYLYIFLTLIIGPLGMYYFLRAVVFRSDHLRGGIVDTEKSVISFQFFSFKLMDRKPIPEKPISQLAAFLGALLYLLNLGTLQQFIVPFEMFNTQYAFLPWLFFFATKFLYATKPHNKKFLILFSIVTLLATPMAYAATLWYVYVLLFGLYLFFITLPSLLKTNTLLAKKAIVLLAITFLLNSFWLLPNLYFVTNHGTEVEGALINKLFSTEALLYNKEFGTIPDILLLRSYLFDWNVYGQNNSFESLLHPWIPYVNHPIILAIEIGIAVSMLVGIWYGLSRKHHTSRTFLGILIICLFFLINDNFPTAWLFTFMQKNVPLFKEALRFPHAKIYIMYQFVYAIFFSLGQYVILKKLNTAFNPNDKTLMFDSTADPEIQNSNSKFTLLTTRLTLYTATITVLLLLSMLPAFQGQLISPYLRIQIPKEYFSLFEYLNKQPTQGRVANLPIQSFWGWEYYDWYNGAKPSFQGAGFLWFGIKLPLLHRDFDRWNGLNEQYYREMSHAIYSQNAPLLKQVIAKYHISYLLLDTSIIAPEIDQITLFYPQIKKMLSSQSYLEKPIPFGTHLFVYKVNPAEVKTDVFRLQQAAAVRSEGKPYYQDTAFEKHGDYTTSILEPSFSFPFLTLTDNQSHIAPNTLQVTQNGIEFSVQNASNQLFANNLYLTSEPVIPASVYVKKGNRQLQVQFFPILPYPTTNANPITAQVPLTQTQKEFSVTINQQYTYDFGVIPENTLYAIGKVFLNTQSPNSLGVFEQKAEQPLPIDFSNLDYSLRPCEGEEKDQVFGVDINPATKGFRISGKNTPICMMVPLKKIAGQLKSSLTLLHVSYDYENNQAQNTSNLCLANLKTGSCIDYGSKSGSFSNHVSSYMSFESKNVHDVGLRIFFDTTNKKSVASVAYTNISLSLNIPIFVTEFSKDIIQKSITDSQPRITQSPFTFVAPFSGKQDLSTTVTTLPKTTGYCQTYPIGQPITIQKEINHDGQFVHYTSEQGGLCDHFSYPNLSHNQAYILMVSARNLEGLPLTICVTNHASKRCDIYARLPKSKTFTTELFLIPQMSHGTEPATQQGYDVNISNLGIRRTPAVNDLASIQFIPIPYNFLSRIEFPANNTTKRSIVSNADFDHPLPHVYTTSLDQSSAKQNETLALGNSFEPGWKAYVVQRSKLKVQNLLQRAFPFWFGTELKDHVKVNNWENGWTLDPSTLNPVPSTLVFIYLPQYLEFAGFFLVIATFMSLFLIPKHKP